MRRRHDRNSSKSGDQFTEQEKRSRINHSKRSAGLSFRHMPLTPPSSDTTAVKGRSTTGLYPPLPAGLPGKSHRPRHRAFRWSQPRGAARLSAARGGAGAHRLFQPASSVRGSHEVQSWTRATKQSLCLVWQKVKLQLMLSMSFLIAVFWYCRRLYSFLAQLLKRWSSYLQRKLGKNHSVLEEVDLLGYSARKWREETKQAKLMREAYNELFQNHHVKYLRQVRKDNYCVLRAVLFQIFSQGIPFPSWMRERDILKLPEKLLYSQGCNWIQQYSFGPESYTGPNAFGKLRKCMETLKANWAEISGTKDHEERRNMCNALFSDESKEHKLYEAIKFIMLYEVVEAYEQMKNRDEPIPHLFSLLFARDSSSDPLSFMMNHLNAIGDSGCLDQVELFLLGYLLEVKIRVYRLHRFNTEEFQVNCPDEYRREWNEISLLTEDDRYYHIPVIRT